ncbi:hypothetical protein B0H11DRAFT_2057849 [Mycena galericulata]|nr:hypothetical protein B0H11DRAFT_2057849 [Mycena galericulata]
MPSLFKVLSLLALTAISGALASPQPALAVPAVPHDFTTPMAPTFEMGKHRPLRSLPEAPSRDRVPSGLTNAQRLARHLPLKPPTRRSSARRALASPAATPANRGYIQVLSVDANGNPSSVLGYVSRTTYVHTQYVVGSSLDDALLVGPSGARDLVTLNSDTPSFSFLGLVEGREDPSSGLAQGSFNYLYLASTQQTSANSTPQNVANSFSAANGGAEQAESAVWTIDPATHVLTAQWINPDGSHAPTISFVQGSAIYFSGDLQAFNQMHPAQVQRIAFLYIPA